MRGKLLASPATPSAARITPAHAGKTAPGNPAEWRDADHPRACGENRPDGRARGTHGGSPPRMRGKRADARTARQLSRITPAHAGKTPSRMSVRARSSGSPPRMRGKPCVLCRICQRERITPAHAGKTQTRRLTSRGRADHPRACGENLIYTAYRALSSGSPPRMRGKPDRGGARGGLPRITPAHAGKTLS